ncbi:MAG: PIN domain-containing protein [Anaerolineae bacterium]|nr:PIN domain-containing protein [Anaerolineae bacterium]
MSQTLILDTVSAIATLNGNLILPDDTILHLPIIALGELYAGAQRSARAHENVRRAEVLAARYAILVCDHDTARQYGRIVASLRKKGRPIPQNDVWIAALALQHNLALLTRDAHFQHVDGLAVQGW